MQYMLLLFQKFVFHEELITVHIKTCRIIPSSLRKEKKKIISRLTVSVFSIRIQKLIM